MSIREYMAAHPGIFTSAAFMLVVLCVGAVIMELRGSSIESYRPTKAFFTTDDGKTLFVDDVTKIPPFDHNGQQAVRAMVYTTDGGKDQWVQYLVKASDSEKQQLEKAGSDAAQALVVMDLGMVKPPGGKTWLGPSDQYRNFVTVPRIPPGIPQGPITLVQP